jgi:hypothetical protein
MKRTTAALAFLALIPAAAQAQNIPGDGTVEINDARLWEALRGSIGTSAISEEIGRQVGIICYEDNYLTPNENDLIVELMKNTGGTVQITEPTGTGFVVPALSQGARDFLSLTDIPDISVFWLAGPQEMKKLVDVTILNPNIRDEVQHFIANQLYLRWRTSNFVNNYSPLRNTLSTAFVQWRDAGPETLEVARGLLYDALVELDMAVNDEVPDDLHERLLEGAG